MFSLARTRRARRRKDEGFAGYLVTLMDPTAPASASYRSLRTNLLHVPPAPPSKVLVLTSPGPAEGKTTTCANLGAILAQADKSTLIVDSDFRTPAIHKIFGRRNIHGLVNVLVGENDLHEVWDEPVENLKVVTVGPVPPNPAELLNSVHFADFVGSVRQQFDYVLIDTAPMHLFSDPTIVATQGDGVLLVIDAQGTSKGSVRKAVRDLQAVGANVLGTVLNNVDAKRGDYYEYGYMYD
jgi:capsular exopolysaccharide synthesis family protein